MADCRDLRDDIRRMNHTPRRDVVTINEILISNSWGSKRVDALDRPVAIRGENGECAPEAMTGEPQRALWDLRFQVVQFRQQRGPHPIQRIPKPFMHVS